MEYTKYIEKNDTDRGILKNNVLKDPPPHTHTQFVARSEYLAV